MVISDLVIGHSFVIRISKFVVFRGGETSSPFCYNSQLSIAEMCH